MIILISLLFIALIAAFLFFLPYIVSKPLEKELNVDFGKVDRITIANGGNVKCVALTNKKDIDGFLSRFSGITVRKDINQKVMQGVVMTVMLFKSGKKTASFNFGGANEILITTKNNYIRYISSKNFSDAQTFKLEKYYKIY